MRAILTYHSIDDSGSVLSLDASTFDRHVRFLASGRVRVVPLEGITAVDPAEDAVALTFDDGYRNFATAAWPRLRDAGLPATVFVVTGRIGDDNPGGGAPSSLAPLELLDWDDLAALAETGAAIGSHTRSHRALPQLGDDELVEEVVGSADDLERRLGRRPDTLCYPFGGSDERVARVAALTYARACTTELRPVRPSDDPHRLPRLDIYYFRSSGWLERWGSRRLRAYLGLRNAGRRVRTVVTDHS